MARQGRIVEIGFVLARASWVLWLCTASCSEGDSSPSPPASTSAPVATALAITATPTTSALPETAARPTASPDGDTTTQADATEAATAAIARSRGAELRAPISPSSAAPASSAVPEAIKKCCAAVRASPPSLAPKYRGTLAEIAKLCDDAQRRSADEKRFLHHVHRTLPPELRRHFPACAPAPLHGD